MINRSSAESTRTATYIERESMQKCGIRSDKGYERE